MMSDQNGTNDSHPIIKYLSKHVLAGEQTRLMYTMVFPLCVNVQVLLYRLLSAAQYKRRAEKRHITAAL